MWLLVTCQLAAVNYMAAVWACTLTTSAHTVSQSHINIRSICGVCECTVVLLILILQVKAGYAAFVITFELELERPLQMPRCFLCFFKSPSAPLPPQLAQNPMCMVHAHTRTHTHTHTLHTHSSSSSSSSLVAGSWHSSLHLRGRSYMQLDGPCV